MNTKEFIARWSDHPSERAMMARDLEALTAALAADEVARRGQRDALRAQLQQLAEAANNLCAASYGCMPVGDALQTQVWLTEARAAAYSLAQDILYPKAEAK